MRPTLESTGIATLFTRLFKITSISLLLVCAVHGTSDLQAISAPDGARRFSYGITGSAHPIETENPSFYFRQPEVQLLVSDMISGPISANEVARRMNKLDGVTAHDLYRTGLLRIVGDRAFLNFALDTEEDITTIRAVINEPLEALTAAYFERSVEISTILDAYPAKTVSKGALAFIILGAFSLDWDGLYLTAESGYRIRPPKDRGHFFWVTVQTDKHDMREVYNGSHNSPAGQFRFSTPFNSTFTSFGDHYRRGRAAFPDIFWQSTNWYKEGEQNVVRALQAFSDEQPAQEGGFVSEQTAIAIADILYALRKSSADSVMLGEIAHVDPRRLSNILNLLVEIQYVAQLPDGQYVLLVPVFDLDDGPMIDALLSLSRNIMETWLDSHYDSIKAELAHTTTMRHGVSYEEYFTNVWHHIFGLQNKEMTRAGLFAHPYGVDKKYKAFLPALWRSELYDLCGKEIFPC